VAETWLQGEQAMDVPKGWTWHGRNRKARRRGGVGILVHEDAGDSETIDAGVGRHEIIWVRVAGRAAADDVYVCAGYIPPANHTARGNINYKDFYDEVLNKASAFAKLGKVLVMMDANAAVGNDRSEGRWFNKDVSTSGHNCRVRGRYIVEGADANGLKILNGTTPMARGPTRVRARRRKDKSGTLRVTLEERTAPDVVLVSDATCFTDLEHDSDGKYNIDSDHEWIFGTYVTLQRTPPKKSKPKRHWRYDVFNRPATSEHAWTPLVVSTEKYMRRFAAWLNGNQQPSAATSTQAQRDAWADRIESKLDDLHDKAATEGVGKKFISSKSRTWWSEECADACKDRREARRKLQDAIRTWRVGADDVATQNEVDNLHETYRRAKKRARRITRRARRNEIHAWDAIQSNDWTWNNKAYWSRMQNRKGATQRMPTAVLKGDGVKTSAPDEVKETYARFYEKIQEDDKSAQGFDDEFRDRIEMEVEQAAAAIDADRRDGKLQQCVIKPETVHSVLKGLDRGRGPGNDKKPYELYKYGGGRNLKSAIVTVLATMFTMLIAAGSIPKAWCAALVVPIYKGKGSIFYPGNWRPIRLLPCVGKIMVECMRVQELGGARAKLNEFQCAFRRGRGTIDHLFVLVHLLLLRTRQRKKTYTAFIDVAKAYDTVWRAGLWWKMLYKFDVPRPVWAMFRQLYRWGRSRVMTAHGNSREFKDGLGVRQGCLASPDLFNFFVNDLLVMLEESGLGVRVRGRRIAVLMYADDIVLIADTPEELQQLLDLVSAYARRWRFRFNTSKGKSEVVIFGRKRTGKNRRATQKKTHLEPEPAVEPAFFVTSAGNREQVRCVDVYKYLGLRLDADLSWSALCAHLKATAHGRMAWLYGPAGRRHNVNLPPRFISRLWLACGRPAVEYGAECCGYFFPDELEKFQRRLACRTLDSRSTTLGTAALTDLGWPQLRVRQEQAMLRYWGRILMMPPTRTPRLLYDALLAENHRSSWTTVVRRLAYEWGLGQVWREQDIVLHLPAGKDVLTSWKHRLRKIANRRARVQATGDLAVRAPSSRIARNYIQWLHLNDSADKLEMAEYIRTARTEDTGAGIMFALRAGTSSLRVDQDRLLRPRSRHQYDTRICRHCQLGKVEDAYHALAKCPANAAARQSLRSKLPEDLKNVDEPKVFDALMMSKSLKEHCPDAPTRTAATEAVKCFWVRVLGERRRQLKQKQ